MFTLLGWIHLCESILIVSVGLPLLIYSCCILHADWNKAYIAKRHRILVIISITLIFCIQFAYIMPSNILFLISGNTDIAYYYLVVISLIPIVYTYVTINTLRIWFLYFDINITKFRLEKAWLVALDPETEKHNWFYKHCNTFGNPYVLVKYSMIIPIVFGLIGSIFHLIGLNVIQRILTWTITLMIAITSGIIFYKLKSHHYDKLGIKIELIYVLRTGGIWSLCVISSIICFQLKLLSFETYYAIFLFLGFIMSNFLLLYTIILPKFTVAIDKNKYTPHKKHMKNIAHNLNDTHNNNNDHKFGSIWIDIAVTSFGFEQLMNHLEKEFSIENLLFVCEVCVSLLNSKFFYTHIKKTASVVCQQKSNYAKL